MSTCFKRVRWTSFALAATVSLAAAPLAHAATRTWAGTTDGAWSKGSNWVGGAVPVAGDTLVFPSGGTTKAMTNDLANGFQVAGMSFDGGYSLTGNSITLGSGGLACAGSGTNSAGIAIALGADVTITVPNTCVIQLTGIVSGAFDITKTGTGLVRLSGANTYSKRTIINGGYVNASAPSALGAGDGTAATETIVNVGGTLQIAANLGNEAITIYGQGDNNNGVLQADDGAYSLGGPVTLGDANVRMIVIAGRELIFNGVLGGSGRFGITGGGVFTLANTGNSFTGPTDFGGSATVKLGASNVIPDSTTMIFTSGSGIFDLNNFSETIAGISGSVNVRTRTLSVLTLNQATDASFSGRFYDSGIVVKTGVGKLTLPFPHFITGTVSTFGGTLIVDSDLPSSATVAPGGVLGGSGTISQGLIATGGVVAPGSSPGILSTGGLSLSGLSTLSVELNGLTPGTGYDQVVVAGTVSLGGSTLAATLGFTPALGNVFTIINNDGSDAVAGTFAGLPEGASVIVNTTPMVVSYIGGTGNDVVLTAGTAVPGMTPWALILLVFGLAAVTLWRLRMNGPALTTR